MRLRRLDLVAYGKFTEQSIDFGEPAPDEADLHIVYGPNEAGKSTALAAFLDLLFGIEARSRYDFLHPYATMRIGAALDVEGAVRELVRIKRPQRSLLDPAGQPVSENLVQGELGGLDRSAYRAMFSLDDETLEAGGESILASKGDLGQLLFSASAGLADLSGTLTRLKDEADRFYKYHARGGELAQLKAALAELRERREGIDTFAAEYFRLREARDHASAQYEAALAERCGVQSRMAEIQRSLSALPRLAALRGIGERLAPLADVPDAPLGWASDLPGLEREGIRLQTEAAGIDREIAAISAELAGIVVDAAAERLTGRTDRLAQLRARHMTAEFDIPVRQRELREVELAIAGILRRLDRAGAAEPERLLINAAQGTALRDLIERRSAVEAMAAAAQDELSDAVHRLGEARTALHAAAGEPAESGAMTALAATLFAVRGSDHAARHQVAERAGREQRERLAERLVALQPWVGDAGSLAQLRVPDGGVVEGWKAAVERHEKTIERHQGRVADLAREQGRLTAELGAIGAVAGVVSDQELAAIRAAREAAWAAHRAAMDHGTADRFEAVLRRDDVVMNARLGHQREVAKLHETAGRLAVLAAELDGERTLLDAATVAGSRVREAIAAALRAMTPLLPDAMTAGELEAWLTRRAAALESWAAVRQAERDFCDAEADASEARERLLAALAAADVPHEAAAGIDVLLRTAQAAVDRAARVTELRKTVADRERDAAARERALQKAETADRAWQGAWRDACAACWLGGGGTIPAVGAVREILPALGELGPALEIRAGLTGRIRDMQRDQAGFAEDVVGIARGLGLDPAAGTMLDLAQAVDDRIQGARAARLAAESRLEAREAARKRRGLVADALAAQGLRAAEMTRYFGVGTLAEVGSKLQDSARKADLRRQADDAVRDILNELRVASIAEAEAVLDRADRGALETQLGELTARFDDLDRRARELFAASRQAADRIDGVGGDDEAARIEEKRRTVLLEIEEKARRYLRLRVGIVAAEQALRTYRDTHRSEMMRRASEAFRLVSRGAYRGLSTRPGPDGEVLIAVGAEGGSKVAADLSKGTRFQLYLALRAAGYQAFAAARRPVPFIADDIMETFDDFRAEEAFRLFGDMAQVGQVIYLTHHRHLCDIAQRLFPRVRVHEIAERRRDAG